MAGKPTISQPWVVNPDGSVSILVWQGRNFRARITHPSMTTSVGWKARVSFKASYDAATPLAAGSSQDGSITFKATGSGGTLITVNIQDEVMEGVTAAKGRWDLVLENPAGEEDTLIAGDFITQPPVTQ